MHTSRHGGQCREGHGGVLREHDGGATVSHGGIQPNLSEKTRGEVRPGGGEGTTYAEDRGVTQTKGTACEPPLGWG